LFAATLAGLYRSENLGQSWERIGTEEERSTLKEEIKDLDDLATLGTVLFVTALGNVHRSEDHGNTWHLLEHGGISAKRLAVIGTTLFTTGSEGVFRSEDLGKSWRRVGAYSEGFDSITGLVAIDDALFAGGINVLFRSDNGGRSWRKVTPATGTQPFVQTLLAVNGGLFAGTPEGIYRSNDKGESWQEASAGLLEGNVQVVATVGNILLAGTSGGVYQSHDSGQSWEQTSIGLRDSAVKNILRTDGLMFAATGHGVYRSEDNGAHWQRASTGLDPSQVRALAQVGNRLFAGTENGVFWSDNRGDTWTIERGANGGGRVLSLATMGTILFQGWGLGVERSDDRGESWEETSNGLPHEDVRTIVVVGTKLFVGTEKGVFRSDDKGQSWREVNNGLSNRDIYVLASFDDKLFAGASLGAAYELDTHSESVSWNQVPTNKVSGAISAFWMDRKFPRIIILGTTDGLFASKNGGEEFQKCDIGKGKPVFENVFAIDYTSGQLFIGTDAGVFYIQDQIPRGSSIEGVVRGILQFYVRHHEEIWFWPIAVIASFITTYLLGTLALLFLAWRVGSMVFSRTWLVTVATKPLLKTPGLGRWAVFVGYKRRLMKLRVVNETAKNYFGLPAEDSSGDIVLPDATGEILHERIGTALRPQVPVLVVGRGGAGKSTVLGRWAFLGIKNQLPTRLRSFSPLLIQASYYEGNLIKAIADTLRERDGVAVDSAIMKAQLQSGKFLILFDGINEVEGDKQKSLSEILRTAQHADFKSSRFLIATRPVEGLPQEVRTFQLQGMTPDVISVLLTRYGLGRERESRVRRQLQAFGDKPIEPLLFTMALAQSGTEALSATRAKLYERYFRRLLKVKEGDEIRWDGWRTALEAFAEWFLLDTGRRGIGLPHSQLMDHISRKRGDGKGAKSLLAALRYYYHLQLKDELDLLQQLQAAGLLQGGRRWRFAHDTFEEYFAASRLVSYVHNEEGEPILGKWVGSYEREQEFVDVIGFLIEMADDEVKGKLLSLNSLSPWRERMSKDRNPGK